MTKLSPSNTRLVDALRSAAGSGRIGRLVFVRWTERVETGTDARAAEEAALAAVAELFGGPHQAAHWLGGPGDGQTTVLARWPGGETALVAAGPAGERDRPGVDVIRVGARGAIYHEYGGSSVR